ncbi:MAG: YheU family protein [Proteobacteria bacterium]|nr:YheU family protein [Pseudomonadota bacterium]
MKRVEVPYNRIDPAALRALIEEYISRDGTFYGRIELSMDQKVDMVLKQLRSGDAIITWDLDSQTGSVVLKDDLKN